MRLKNVKGAKEKIENSSYVVLEPKKYRGCFQNLFQNDHPIHIEIGMGKGNFLIENAKRYPEINFIGIEKFDSVIVRAIEKLDSLELPNLRLIRMDATEIDSIFDQEITTVYLNFSDPWPKNRHELRRLSSPVFLKKYEPIFRGEKHIKMKTDNRKLFEYSLKTFSNDGYRFENLSLNLYEDLELLKDNIPTEYESKFVEKGCIIYFVEVSKK